jgi:outer membrane lipoprotein-sorting protein
MEKRLLGLSVALVLAAGCGRSPVGAETPTTEPGTTTPEPPPVTTPPQTGTPGEKPAAPGDLSALKTEVTTAYQAVKTLKADYENRQSKGGEKYYAKVAMTFAKPRKLRLDIRSSSDALLSGAIVVWMGGSTLKGRKDIGFIPIKQEHKLTDKPSLRGWYYNQTDYDATVTSLLANLGTAKLLGTSQIGSTKVTMVEFKSTLPGAATERIGVDQARKLPVYREFREAGSTTPVFTTTYTNLQVNAPIAGNAFDIF